MATPDHDSAGQMDYEHAIKTLLDGNRRYQAGTNCAKNPCPKQINLESGQAPFAAFIRCADSRVAPEIVFDQPLGSLFVCGVAGNIATDEIVASLEYAIFALGTRLIVIMGHSSCGAVTAAHNHDGGSSVLPGRLPELVERIRPAISGEADGEEPSLEEAIEKNANATVDDLLLMSELIAGLVAKRELQVIAGIEDLKSGRFSITKQAFYKD
jgi:carbonic anhydrase